LTIIELREWLAKPSESPGAAQPVLVESAQAAFTASVAVPIDG
jgi:hypothetical protein